MQTSLAGEAQNAKAHQLGGLKPPRHKTASQPKLRGSSYSPLKIESSYTRHLQRQAHNASL